MPVKAVIFDLDGTLVDSLSAIMQAFHAVSDALDLPRADRATAQGFVGSGVPIAMTRMLNWAGADPALHPRALSVMLEAYEAVPPTANIPYPGMRAALEALDAQGIPMALCTNKPEAPTIKLVDALKLGPFRVIASGDTLPVRKPDPAPLLHCLSGLGVAAQEALYVGDSDVDHKTAAAAGVPFALFEGGYLNAPLGAPAPALTFGDWSDFALPSGLPAKSQ